MKIHELIALLQEYEPDTVVSVNGYEGGVTDHFGLVLSCVTLDCNEERYYGEHEVDKKKGDGVRLVISR